MHRQTSNLRRNKSQDPTVSRLVFAQTIETRYSVENEDVVGASPWVVNNALPTKVRLILEGWR